MVSETKALRSLWPDTQAQVSTSDPGWITREPAFLDTSSPAVAATFLDTSKGR